MFRLIVCISIQSLITIASFRGKETQYYTNTWAVHVSGGVHRVGIIAGELGFDSPVPVSEGLDDVYLLRNSEYPVEMEEARKNVTMKLRLVPEISWAEQQVIAYGVISPVDGYKAISPIDEFLELTSPDEPLNPQQESRELPAREECLNLSDVHWTKQYYLQNCQDVSQNEPSYVRDLNVTPVWTKHQLFGKNVKVIVVDEGIQTDHSDLVDNYDPRLGLDILEYNLTPDPVPSKRSKHAHGTKCAGIIAMRANNTVCGVGVAPLATLGAVRLLKGPRIPSDAERAKALLFKHTKAHISSNSWTYSDPGGKRWKEAPLTNTALKTGATKGRGGKGLIYVFACGSHKAQERNCSCDPLRTSIYTILVASCDYRGKIIFFSEKCAGIMVTTYSSIGAPLGHGVVTTDVGKDACTTKFSGTSASTPMVSGAIALALEANPDLTWRDVQHLLTWTSQVAPLQDNRHTWRKNGAGFYVSHDFGFGMLNVNELVEKAMSFQSVGAMNTCVSSVYVNSNGEKFRSNLELRITSNGCKGSPAEVMYLEHVQVALSLKYPKRGDLKIILVSPLGTRAVLLGRRSFDSYQYGIENGIFNSVMTWGESPEGTWTVRIMGKKRVPWFRGERVTKMWSDHQDKETYAGKLRHLQIIFYGSSGHQKPQHYTDGPRSYHNFTIPDERPEQPEIRTDVQ